MMPMTDEKRKSIAVIVEDSATADFIVLILIGEDYKVNAYSSQNEALPDLEKNTPDLIICDFKSPAINGLDVCKVLRKNFLFQYIPIIFIMPDTDPLNKAKLIYTGADDYMDRDAVEHELIVKVRLNLYRTGRQRDINPVTGLPGQAGFIRELEKRLETKKIFAVFYSDLLNFKLYNQKYGFKKGDDVLRFNANLILTALKDLGTPSDFVAHPHSDDFIFLSSPDSIKEICERILKVFNVGIRSFYSDEDKVRECIEIKNRKGEILKIPFLCIHLGVVTNEDYEFINAPQVIQIASELKDYIQKNSEKSMFVKERRKKYPFA